MNTQFVGVGICLAVALAIQSVGPVDASLAVYVVGGADCNASDTQTWDCVEINGRVTPCSNVIIGADDVQVCLDTHVESQVICTQNNCENVTKDRKSGSTCTTQGCGGS